MTTEKNNLENNLENKLRIQSDENTDENIPPQQNELDLEFDKMDPVIPKKTTTQAPSILNKAKSLVHSFGKKEKDTFQSNVDTRETTVMEERQTDTDEKNVETAPITENLKKPERWAILQILPVKYRRLFIVLLIIIILLLLFSWLKPKSDTVQSFEEKTSKEIPTQFQSLDSNQPMEPTVLETLNTQNNDSSQEQMPVEENSINQDTVKNELVDNVEKNNSVKANTANLDTNNNTTQASTPVSPVTEQVGATQVTEQVKPTQVTEPHKTENKPAVTKPIETTKKIVQEKSTVKETVVAKPEKHKSMPSRQQQQEMQKLVNKLSNNTAHSTKANHSNGKTLTIEKGKSLMQIFRDNNLNISDVNAMTKAKGANNALSSFSPGDKVQILLNNQGRVSELKLENGSRFIRQKDGNYQFQK